MKAHLIGLPCIGRNRELKFVIEKYLVTKSKLDKNIVNNTITDIIRDNIMVQVNNKLDMVSIGYHYITDPVTYTMINLGIMPVRFGVQKTEVLGLDNIIAVTKGIDGMKPFKMTKWFGTNYHYFVPEINLEDCSRMYQSGLLDREISMCTNLDKVKIVVIGPVTFIKLSSIGQSGKGIIVNNIIKRYVSMIKRINNYGNVKWIELDEPIISNSNAQRCIKALGRVLRVIRKVTDKKVLLALCFNNIRNCKKWIMETNLIDGIHIGGKQNSKIMRELVGTMDKIVSLGVVSGSDIWVSDVCTIAKWVRDIYVDKKVWISSDCSMLHVPYDNEGEIYDRKEWTSFAVQKIKELVVIKDIVMGSKGEWKDFIECNAKTIGRIRESRVSIKEFVRGLVLGCDKYYHKDGLITLKQIGLQRLPNTTIGSFPQTKEIRNVRVKVKNKSINKLMYNDRIKEEIVKVIRLQEKYNVDVLVNGEIERNDMVEYFCSKLEGCAISNNGWVQSYSTRCVKPAIIWGMIKTKDGSVTTEWNRHLIGNTNRICKAILTGPVTMTKWTFTREDVKKKYIALMFAFFLREEIRSIVELGMKIIQVDEPALKEASPVNDALLKKYYGWVTKCFKIACYYAYKNKVQIHSHICYSLLTFTDLMLIKGLGIDVITIEASKNLEENIQLIKSTSADKFIEVGLGVYDVHSRYIPTVNVLVERITKIIENIDIDRVWINPDCGLKTRSVSDVESYLKNLAKAIKVVNHYCNIK